MDNFVAAGVAPDCFDAAYHDALTCATEPSAESIVETILREFDPRSVVDIGCGTGVYLEHLLRRGVDVLGVEKSTVAIAKSRVGRDHLVAHDLNRPFAHERRYDLALCFEVGQSIDPQRAGAFIDTACSLSGTVLFSAAQTGQGGAGHINEQPWEYWLALFWECGYELDLIHTSQLRHEWAEAGAPSWFGSNLAVLTQSPCSTDILSGAMQLVDSVEGWLTLAEARILFAAARQTPRASSIVEIGSWKGRSTAALALGSLAGEGAPVYAVDHHHGARDIGEYLGTTLSEIRSWNEFQANLQALRITDAVKPILRDSLAAEATWDGRPIDVLWIDGGHEYEIVKSDFEAWRGHVRRGGIIAIHDTTGFEGPRRVAEEAVKERQLLRPVRIDSLTYGMASGSESGRARRSTLPPMHGRRERISIMFPTHDEGSRLRSTVDSLLRNTHYPDYEVLILDDASADDSCDFLFLPPYSRDKRLRYVRVDQAEGHLKRRVEGVTLATGEVFQFIDAHHCFSPDWLSNVYDCLRRHDGNAIVGPAVSVLDPVVWGPTSVVTYGWSCDTALQGAYHIGLHEVRKGGRVPWLSGHQMMMTRRLYDDIGGICQLFPGHGTDDLDLCLRAFLLGHDCYIEPTAIIGHYYKSYFVRPPTWEQLMVNYLVTVYLNLGPERFAELKAKQAGHYGYEGGCQAFERMRPEIERFRSWIVSRQKRSTVDLLALLEGKP